MNDPIRAGDHAGACNGAHLTTLLRALEVATLLRVSPRTFEALVKRGEAPAHFCVGRQRRWDLSVVEQWIAERSAGALKTRAKPLPKT